MRLASLLFIFLLAVIGWAFFPNESRVEQIHGASLVNPPRPIGSESMAEVKRVNAEWVAVIPYAFSRARQPKVTFDHERQWWGEHTDGNCILVQYAKEHNLKVMVKPHVWSMGEGWVGDFDLESESDWKTWEQDYSTYILHHASKADSLGAEMLCIGTEYRIPARERPEFWRNLIKEVRKRYSGKITYASNWDNYENITWWDAVDYIGIDAYFPLVDGSNPSMDEIVNGWQPIKQEMASFASKWNKQILFTEYGFQSVNGATGRHWEVDKSESNVNEELQANAYEATFRVFEDEAWYAGGFFWKWHFNSRNGRWRGTEWTPQNKPAEQVIARWYSKKD